MSRYLRYFTLARYYTPQEIDQMPGDYVECAIEWRKMMSEEKKDDVPLEERDDITWL